MSTYRDDLIRDAPATMGRVGDHVEAFFGLVREASELTEGELRSRLAELSVTGTLRHDYSEASEAVYDMERWMRYVDKTAIAATALAELPVDYPLMPIMSGPPPGDDEEDAPEPHVVGVMTVADVAFELARGGITPYDVMRILWSRGALRPTGRTSVHK